MKACPPPPLSAGGSSREGNEGSEYEFAAGDTVRVDLDLESAKLMQEDHGGWVDAMNGVRNFTSV